MALHKQAPGSPGPHLSGAGAAACQWCRGRLPSPPRRNPRGWEQTSLGLGEKASSRRYWRAVPAPTPSERWQPLPHSERQRTARQVATTISKPLSVEARPPPHTAAGRPRRAGDLAGAEAHLVGARRGGVLRGTAKEAGKRSPRPPGPCSEAAGAPRVLLEAGAALSPVRQRRAAVAARGYLRAGAVTAAPCEAQRCARRGRAGVSQKRLVKHCKRRAMFSELLKE